MRIVVTGSRGNNKNKRLSVGGKMLITIIAVFAVLIAIAIML